MLGRCQYVFGCCKYFHGARQLYVGCREKPNTELWPTLNAMDVVRFGHGPNHDISQLMFYASNKNQHIHISPFLD